MKFSRITPVTLIIIFAMLALLMAYLVLHHEFWNMVVRCGQLCGSLMAEPVIRMLTK